MELCEGGSLHKILGHPMNRFGIEEIEFLNVLRDLTAGMKYMRENGIIHRDLKPANIMRFICDDGSNLYKIADFGAARELVDGEEYSSIYGTEEYLHPDVYEQLLLRNGKLLERKKFAPCTDLWSIGATLYHVATGMLPFRPNGGRQNRETMHIMTTTKKSGVISAHQPVGDDEKIIFEDELPKSCLLTPAFKELICPLLAGLMEVDPSKKLSFKNYFLQVEAILSRKQLNIFFFDKLQSFRLYLHPNETATFDDLARVIFENTQVRSEHQILFFENTTLKHLLESQTKDSSICSKLPETNESNQVILLNRIEHQLSPDINKSRFKEKSFPPVINYQEDAQIATQKCIVAFLIKSQIIANSSKVTLIKSAVETITKVGLEQLTSLSNLNTHTNNSIASMSNQFELMHSSYLLCKQFGKLVPYDVTRFGGCEESTGTFHERVKELKSLYSSQFSEFQDLKQRQANFRQSFEPLFGVENRVMMDSLEPLLSQVKVSRN